MSRLKVFFFLNNLLKLIFLLKFCLKKVYTDCSDYFRAGFREDGVYELTPVRSDLEKRFDVYCNMTKGGWTVIMKREAKNKNVNFEQDLKQYKRGFGSLMTDHWLGE